MKKLKTETKKLKTKNKIGKTKNYKIEKKKKNQNG